jgi:hypothetical protein
MKAIVYALPIQFTMAIAVMATAGVQDRAVQVTNAVQVPTAQQEWRFDVNQPDWKPLPESDPTFTGALVGRTPDALRVTIPDGRRRGSGTLGGGIYVDVPPSSVPFRVVVQARTRDAIRLMMVGINLSTTGDFQTFFESTSPVSDGAVHTYGMFVPQIKDAARQVGLWFRASEPGSVDILSIKFVRQATTDRWEYRGFAVDVAAPDASWNRDAFLQALRRQFDIVASARLDERTLDFFRSLSIVMDPVAPADQIVAGRYRGDTIVIMPRVYDPDAPVFLHEFVHAYHDQKLPSGFRNPDILRLFKEAGDSQAFPADSYMMSNVTEYFAMAGSTYLHGSEPSFGAVPGTRENLKNRQPALYQWLVKEFGAR